MANPLDLRPRFQPRLETFVTPVRINLRPVQREVMKPLQKSPETFPNR